MNERERTIIRVVGLAVHALGLVVGVGGLLAESATVAVVGGVLFLVGGAWGWGMVRAAWNESERVRQHEANHAAYLERRGLSTFTARFDDDPEVAAPGTVTGSPMPVLKPPPDRVWPEG